MFIYRWTSVGTVRLFFFFNYLTSCQSSTKVPIFHNRLYSLSECLLTCRLDDVVKFCGCIPVQFSNVRANQRFCLLDDISCLARWKNVWFNFEPIASDGDGKAQRGNQQCPECLPQCSFGLYVGHTMKGNIPPSQAINKNPSRRNFLWVYCVCYYHYLN